MGQRQQKGHMEEDERQQSRDRNFRRPYEHGKENTPTVEPFKP